MKILFTAIFCIFYANIKSVEFKSDYRSAKTEKQITFNRFVNALAKVESNNNSQAINIKENAVGLFQIRPIRIKDFNQRTGKNYSIEQMHTDSIAFEVFNYYVKGSYEEIARNWNGGPSGMSKQSTLKYWNKIKRLI
jgi:hypothetical protein